ncbi:MAG: hypothetical protein MOB07_03340 [Acidobacteria bacterium]|nr:hypothetical protein [Acidobacteriota bacterium]
MKILIASLIIASLISGSTALAQTEENEIRLLIARAPVAEAAAKAEEEMMIVGYWLMALAYTGHTKEAFATAAKIRKWMSKDDANAAIALGLAIAGKVDEAISVSHVIKDPDFQGFYIIILAKAGRFTEALNEARKSEDGSERDKNLQLVAQELAVRGEVKQALEIAGAIKNKKSVNEVLSGAIKELLKAGKISEAKSIAERIRTDNNERSPLTSAIFDVVFDVANYGDQENALAMVDLIEDEATRSWPLSVIAESFIETGKLDDALDVARRIKDESLLSITLAKVAAAKENKASSEQETGIEVADQTTVEGLLKTGKIDEAITVAQSIKDEDDRSEAFAEASEFLLRSGSYQQARLVADRCPSPTLRLSLYLEILNEIAFKRNPQLRAQVKNYRLIDE